MPRKKKMRKQVKTNASAKFEAVAIARYEHKKVVKEIIPPDVTRAKIGRWLDLISPITEWAGLKGDALRYKRHQLRIQQEESLERLAMLVHDRLGGESVKHPLPPKIVVPALEAASLEHVDSPFLEWWADLLVSGAKPEISGLFLPT